jgi:hypothetical protein
LWVQIPPSPHFLFNNKIPQNDGKCVAYTEKTRISHWLLKYSLIISLPQNGLLATAPPLSYLARNDLYRYVYRNNSPINRFTSEKITNQQLSQSITKTFEIETYILTWIEAFLVESNAQNLSQGLIGFYRIQLHLFTEFCDFQLAIQIGQIDPSLIGE